MTTAGLEGFVELFRSSLEALAAAPAEQIAYLTELGVPGNVDELALQFDDAMPMLPQLRAEGLVSETAGAALTAVDDALSELTDGPASLWSEDGLTTAPAWQAVRDLSSDALGCLPLPVRGSEDSVGRSEPITGRPAR